MNPRTAIASRIAFPVVVLSLLLAGCAGGGDRLAEDYQNGSGAGYVSGDGSIITVAADERGDAVEFGGELDSGERLTSSDFGDRVVVVNFWYASCPPCREEADDLETLSRQYGGDVVFVGVNLNDTATVAKTFATEHGVSYPSFIDYQDSAVQLAFATTALPPLAPPSTIVLDAEGRVAARISAPITASSPLGDIIDDLRAEAS